MRGYAAIGLDNPKFDSNIGGAMRASHCYGAGLVIVGGSRYQKELTDTTKAHRTIPTLAVESVIDSIPYDCVPIAVDMIDGAIPLPEFKHPERAFYIFGAEDATLGKVVTDRCKHTVYVPTNYCMNLASTVNVILYDRMAKMKDPA